MSRSYRSFFLFSFLLCCFELIILSSLYAQFDQVWIFGKHAGLDFKGRQASAIESSIDGFGEGSASVTDENGQLLFYTEGSVVWDKQGNVMPGGVNLLPLGSLNEYSSTSSSAQGTLIIPEPGSASRYYVFSLTSIEQNENAGRLYYSIVDMSLNNGRGAVDANEKGIFLDSGLKEQMTSIVGEKCNVWLIVRSMENVFKCYSVSGSGINRTPRLSNTGTTGGYGALYTGQMTASPNGRKLATAYSEAILATGGCLELFDFDPATGLVSHPVKLDSTTVCIGVAFSPDNTKVYASFMRALYQFDLAAAVPAAAKTLISNLVFPSQLKLGPDGKIYGGSAITPQHQYSMSIINSPNSTGLACQFMPDALPLKTGTSMRLGLSNVINYVTETKAKSEVFHTNSPCWFSMENGYVLQTDAVGWDYTWDDSSSGKERLVKSSGRYWVNYYTAPCQLHTDTFWFEIPYGVLPRIEINASCANVARGKAWAYTYPADTVNYQYIWRNGQNDILSLTDTLENVPAGLYSLQISTVVCDTTLWVEIPELKEQVAFSVDSLICVGDTVTFQNRSDSYYTDFSWIVNDHVFSNVAQPQFIADQPGVFVIQLAGTGPVCRDTAYQFITVDSLAQTYFMPSDDSICVGQQLSFEVKNKDNSLVAQTWLFGAESYQGNLEEDILVHAFDRNGLQVITLQTRYRACPLYEYRDTIFIEALPVVDLGADQQLCLGSHTVTLENRYDLTSVHYLWSTGDTSGKIRITHPGWYTLTAYTLPLGCSSTGAIEIKKDCYLDIPNAFTPNGDGTNDFFFPRQLLSSRISSFRMKIFNRWGQLLFETASWEGKGWDGKWNGRDQLPGLYIYQIEADIDNAPERYTGNVTLLR